MLDLIKFKNLKFSQDTIDRYKREDDAIAAMTPEQREEYWKGQREAAEQADFMWKSQEALYGKGSPFHVSTSKNL